MGMSDAEEKSSEKRGSEVCKEKLLLDTSGRNYIQGPVLT